MEMYNHLDVADCIGCVTEYLKSLRYALGMLTDAPLEQLDIATYSCISTLIENGLEDAVRRLDFIAEKARKEANG